MEWADGLSEPKRVEGLILRNAQAAGESDKGSRLRSGQGSLIPFSRNGPSVFMSVRRDFRPVFIDHLSQIVDAQSGPLVFGVGASHDLNRPPHIALVDSANADGW